MSSHVRGFLTIVVCSLLAPLSVASEKCKPNAGPSGPCLSRNGVCSELLLDGKPTIAHGSPAQFSKMLNRAVVCSRASADLSPNFTVVARAGGRDQAWIGELQGVDLIAYALDDFDEAIGAPIEARTSVALIDGVAHHMPYGKQPRGLKPGEYVFIITVRGSGNWDRHTVYARVAPAK